MNHVAVGIIAQDSARFTMFSASLTGLETPPDTKVTVAWEIGHNIPHSLNLLMRGLLKTDFTHVLFLGDDHVFAPDYLTRLLEHDLEMVAGLCLTRQPPFKPVVFTGFSGDKGLRRRLILENQEPGLVPVHSMGTAGMLVKREVFETLTDPWYEYGQIDSAQLTEDLYFCDKAREAGYQIHCDTSLPLGHITTATVWPVKHPDGWSYGFTFMGGLKLAMQPSAWAEADEAIAEAIAA